MPSPCPLAVRRALGALAVVALLFVAAQPSFARPSGTVAAAAPLTQEVVPTLGPTPDGGEGAPAAEEQIRLAPTILPEGFVQDVVAAGLELPTSFAFLPDGRILVAEKGGMIRVVQDGVLLPEPLLNIKDQVNQHGDRGLLYVAVDPDFGANGFIYALYTYEDGIGGRRSPTTGRISRFTVAGNAVVSASELVLLGTAHPQSCEDLPSTADCLPADFRSHSGGSIQFAPDGTLFISVGEGAIELDDAMRAQDLDSLGGKVLHVTPDGKGIETNPFWTGDPNANRSKVWAYGLRHPFRMALHPANGTPYVADVGSGYSGETNWEEINVAVAGANFGWPCVEGELPHPQFSDESLCLDLMAQQPLLSAPLFAYDNQVGRTIIGGTFYTGATFPAEYQGAYFYADYLYEFVRSIKVDEANQLVAGPIDFAGNTHGPVQLLQGPNESLYYLSINTGELRRIHFVGAVEPAVEPAPPTS